MFSSLPVDPAQISLLGLIAATSLIYAARYLAAPNSLRRSLFKTAPVVLMALLAVLSGGPMLLVVALLLSATGDYFMSLHDRYFIPGLAAFLAGHLAYIGLFLAIGGGASVVSFASLGVFAVIMAAYFWGRAGKYRLPVMAYIAVISVMAATSLHLPPTYTLAVYGAFAFVISDLTLALRMFVFGAKHPREVLLTHIVWATYIPAQMMILLGVT